MDFVKRNLILLNIQIWLLILSSPLSFASLGKIEEGLDVYQAIQQEIEKKFPPESHVYVTVGRSPVMLQALWEIEKKAAINLPFSIGQSDTSYARSEDAILREVMKSDRAKAIFDAFLPPQAEMEGKALVLIDFVASGQSLAVVSEAINRYYSGTVNVIPFGIITTSTPFRLLRTSCELKMASLRAQTLPLVGKSPMETMLFVMSNPGFMKSIQEAQQFGALMQALEAGSVSKAAMVGKIAELDPGLVVEAKELIARAISPSLKGKLKGQFFDLGSLTDVVVAHHLSTGKRKSFAKYASYNVLEEGKALTPDQINPSFEKLKEKIALLLNQKKE